MAGDGRLELDVVDVDGNRLTDRVAILLRHHVLDEELRATAARADHTIAIGKLRQEPQGLYALTLTTRSYQPVRRFVTIPASGARRETVTLPIRPDRARPIFPEYDALDDR